MVSNVRNQPIDQLCINVPEKKVGWQPVWRKTLVVSEIKFEYVEIGNQAKNLGHFRLRRSRCIEKNLKSAKGIPFCKKKITFETDGRKAS